MLVSNACRVSGAQTRAEILSWVKQSNVRRWCLRQDIAPTKKDAGSLLREPRVIGRDTSADLDL
jgi:hypothetical protein